MGFSLCLFPFSCLQEFSLLYKIKYIIVFSVAINGGKLKFQIIEITKLASAKYGRNYKRVPVIDEAPPPPSNQIML